MNITTTNTAKSTEHAYFYLDCSNSTAVSEATIMFSLNGESFVSVTYRSGDWWGYYVPNPALLAGFDERSVGRFVALFVKPNATQSCLLARHKETVGA